RVAAARLTEAQAASGFFGSQRGPGSALTTMRIASSTDTGLPRRAARNMTLQIGQCSDGVTADSSMIGSPQGVMPEGEHIPFPMGVHARNASIGGFSQPPTGSFGTFLRRVQVPIQRSEP